MFGVQFHPEVTHTPHGIDIFQNFLYEVCGCTGSWRMADFLETEIERIHDQVPDGRVICGLSGGVDSALVAAIAADALGPESVRGVMLPSRYTSEGSLRDAAEVARRLGIALEEVPIAGGVTAIHEALERLAVIDVERARIIELRFFGGLSHPEIAEVLGTSLSTVERKWRLARAWLCRELE